MRTSSLAASALFVFSLGKASSFATSAAITLGSGHHSVPLDRRGISGRSGSSLRLPSSPGSRGGSGVISPGGGEKGSVTVGVKGRGSLLMSMSGKGCIHGWGEILSFDGRDGEQVRGYLVRPKSPDTLSRRGVLVLGDVFGLGEEGNMSWCDALSVMRPIPDMHLEM